MEYSDCEYVKGLIAEERRLHLEMHPHGEYPHEHPHDHPEYAHAVEVEAVAEEVAVVAEDVAEIAEEVAQESEEVVAEEPAANGEAETPPVREEAEPEVSPHRPHFLHRKVVG